MTNENQEITNIIIELITTEDKLRAFCNLCKLPISIEELKNSKCNNCGKIDPNLNILIKQSDNIIYS